MTWYSVEIGDRAVWVNDSTGCIGRFGVNGIDVHRPASEQSSLGECLDCTHGRTTAVEWTRFQVSMWKHHRVDLSHIPAPNFVEKHTDAE